MKTIREWKKSSPHEIALLNRCKRAVRDIVPEAELILYGSRARGSAGPESDYDILVLIDSSVTPEMGEDIHTRLYDVELDEDVVISSVIFEHDQWNTPLYKVTPFYRHVNRDGVLL